ncbi:MAG: hypothetical protein AAF494_00660 [Pseudomonadota bacterium]
MFDAMRHVVDDDATQRNAHINAGRQLVAAAKQAKSIDAVIDALEDKMVETMGKLAIVTAILEAESASAHFAGVSNSPGSLKIGKFANAWHARFATLLIEGRKASDVGDVFENLEVINFNYDRTLEVFLLHSISGFYGLAPVEVQPIVATLPMHRPYGKVGELRWLGGGVNSIKFGEGRPDQIAAAYKQVRTFTERVEEGEELAAIKQSIANADRIVFLGFGFHRQNLELLSAPIQPHCELVGTTMGLSPDDTDLVLGDLQKNFGIHGRHDQSRFKLRDLGCADFFDQFGRRLSSDPIM